MNVNEIIDAFMTGISDERLLEEVRGRSAQAALDLPTMAELLRERGYYAAAPDEVADLVDEVVLRNPGYIIVHEDDDERYGKLSKYMGKAGWEIFSNGDAQEANVASWLELRGHYFVVYRGAEYAQELSNLLGKAGWLTFSPGPTQADAVAEWLTRAGRLVAADDQEFLVSQWLMARDWVVFQGGRRQEVRIAMYLNDHKYLCIRRDDQLGDNLAHNLNKIGGKGFQPGEGIHHRAMQWAADNGATTRNAAELTTDELLDELRRRLGER